MRKLPATTVYLILTAASTLFNYSVFTVSAIYRVNVAGLNPLQLVLVGTVMEATVFLCEIPTGVLADVYSRRWSIVIGTFLVGAAFILEGTCPISSCILLAQVLWGIGYTFMSGAEQAWIADEVGEERVQQVYLRAAQISYVGGLFGTFLSVGLASLRLGLPIVMGGCCFIGLGVFLALFMPEQGFEHKTSGDQTSWGAMTQTLQSGICLIYRQPMLLLILGIGAFHGLASEGLDRLWEWHFLENFTFPDLGQLQPIVWFGIIHAIANLLNILGVEIVRQPSIQRFAAARILFVMDSLLVASLITFGLAHSFELALAACWSTDLLRAVHHPLYTVWINQKLDSATRATVFSLSSQVNAIGQILGGPLVGVIGNHFSVRAAIATSGIMLVPVLLLYFQAFRLNRKVVTDRD
ncbi:MFS transporter [Kovacikia minuta CCNUW1]|uniref:MFS transporter n=1 Tax=Kovacikia minuta TaxID=2931930 RepID=UPI001CCF4C4C|nr:MFS transporter [Kovacikia minuta]UBF27370.1 MFS transporter [Kovacikia minuta CCNUW1]